MILVILTALTAVSASPFRIGNFGLSSGHLSAKTVGGSPSAVVAPLGGSIHGLPTGSYTNDAQGVVVDAVNPGTRTSGLEPTGLGGPRLSYGSTDSKVGDATFKVSGTGVPAPNTRIAPGFGSFVADRAGDKASGTLKFTTDVGKENYSYGFETDNGIAVGENGVAEGGVKAEGGYSYKGDDGKTYSVSYTADHGGFKPQGNHLPTPPPIPKEILISLEKNAKEEAAGHVDDGSYDAQKYNNEGDYSSNSASNNNGVSTIGGGDATSSSSYVSQSNQVHRPTSGVLVGSYKPDSVAIQSSQGLGAGISGNTQSSFSLGSSQGAQSSSSLPSTDIRFGVQGTKSGSSQAQASSGASAYSSAVATGSGSASAFASTGFLNSGFRNEYNPTSNSLGLVGQNTQSLNLVSDSSAGASISAPSTATASASVSGSQTQLSGFEKGSQSTNLPSSATASATVSGNQNSLSYTNQQVSGLNAESNSNAFPSRFGETIDSSSATQFSGPQSIQGVRPTKVPATELTTPFESNVQPASVPYDQLSIVIPLPAKIPATLVSSTNAGSVDSTYSSSTQKPFLSQQQGVDNSYHYNQPSKPFIIPSGSFNSQYSNNLQSTPISSISQPDSSSNVGITQAAITPFTSDSSSSSSTQFTSQSSQLGSKPSSQFGQQTSTQFGSTETHFGQKPIVQSQTQLGQSSTQSGSSQSSTQENQGTIYHYNKPATALPAQENTDTSSNAGQSSLTQSNLQGQPGQIETGSKLEAQQASSQFGSQTTLQQTQTGSNTQTTQLVQQPAVTSQVTSTNNQQSQVNSLGSQVDQTPQTTQGSTVSSNANAQTSFVSTTNRFSEKPQTSQGTGSTTTFGQTSFDQKPSLTTQTGSTYQLGQFGSGTNFGSKPQTTQSSGFTYSPGQTSQFGKNPVSTTQTGSTSQQSQVGTSSFQFGQISQNTGASVSTIKPIYNRQPIGSLYQQTPVGSTVSPFGFKPQTQGSSFSFSQGQTSLLEKKPVISTTLTGSQFGQNTQSTLGSTTSQTSFGTKPVSQQTQFGTIGSQYYQGQTSQFGKKPVITTQTGILPHQTQFGSFSTTPKPFSQNQFGSSGFQFGYPQTQFGKKPFGTVQFGVTSQQNKFGSSGFQFGQASQSTVGAGSLNSKFGQTSQTTVGAGSVSTTAKPVGSSFSQNQFGSTGSQFGSKPQTSQGSGFTFSQTAGQTSQFEKKPVITTQTGLPPQQSLFGSAGSKFGQSSQSALGAGSVFTTPKPFYTIKPVVSTFTQNRFGSTGTQFGSSSSQFGQSSQSNVGAGLGSTTPKPFSQNQFGSTGFQFGSKPQTSQGSSFTYSQTAGQTSQFGKKPVGTVQFGVTSQQNKLGSSGFQFGQTSQSSVDTGSVNSQSGQTAQSAVGTGSLNSQIGQNAQSNVETVSVNSQIGQTSQSNVGTDLVNSQIGETAQSTEGTGSVNSQIGQPAQSTVGAGLVNSQIGQTAQSTVGAGLVNSQIGQTSQSTVGTGSVNSQIGQTSQSNVGVGSVSTTTQKPLGSSLSQSQFGSTNFQFGSKPQTSLGSSFSFGKKPSTIQSTGFQVGSQGSVVTTPKPVLAITPVYQQPQFATSGSKLTQGTGSVTTVNKPLFGQTSFGSSWQQNQFGQFGKKPSETGSAIQQTVVGSTDSQKPLTSTVTGVTSTTSQTSSGQKPSSTQFGAPGSVFGLKPQSALQGSSFTSNAGSKGQVVYTTQFGLNGLFQNKGSSSQFGTQLGSGAQIGQKPQTSLGIVGSNTGLTSQTGNKFSGSTFQFGQTNQAKPVQTQFSTQPFGSSQNTQGSTQITSTPSRFGESVQTNVPIITTISQTAQPTQIGQKPSTTQFGSTFGQFGQKPQAYGSAFATSSGSNVAPFGVTQVTNQVSKYQQTSQFGVNQAANSNVGSGQFAVQAVKPFGSQLTQTTYQQTQNQKLSGSSQGSTFQTGQSVVDQPAQGTGQTISLTGYNYQKPQTGLPLVGGLQIDSQDQKVQQTQSNVNSVVSTTQAPITEQSLQPLEVSSTLDNTQHSQSTVGLSQVGAQPTKPTVITGPVIQTTYNQFSGQTFKPTSTVSTLGSTAQSQASAISTSQFGVQPTAPAATAQFGVQPAGASLGSQNVVGSVPEYTVQPSQGVFLSSSSPSQFSVEPYTPSIASSSEAPSFPNRVGTEEGLFVSNVDAQAIVPVPGFEIVTAEQGSQGVVGFGEIFGGPRDPPKFDDKTGYHY